MQRDAIALEDIAARDNLLLAVWKAARGKRQRPAVVRFLADLDGRLAGLAEDILSGSAPCGRVRRFAIRDPKPRLITAACFTDRVLHHAILNLAEPRFERMLVDSCYACRPGKGVHAAIAHAQRQLQRWPWFVQVDVDGYFPAVDHARLKDLLASRFKGRGFLDLLGRIIDGGAVVPGRGLPIGSLTSQHFANAYLDAGDRRLLQHPAVRAHVRYMDDIVWWCPSRAAAEETLADLADFLARERALCLKPTARLGESRYGLRYCGFRVRPGGVFASSRKLSRYRAGSQRIAEALNQQQVDEATAQRAQDGLLATLAGSRTLGFRQRLHALGNAGEAVYPPLPGGWPR
ncbi:reverse transcriptase/maturase family protein [Azovibrio restrictus]|uniref:reverse transcriptase/maturase family protein n=1 Tax=Azovibrio restrictus TaxID=146938 RepID=UPI0026EA4D63|nr:reverse transcriptase/maturase family protein [Azovibrio restrictus]MDD3482751.1 reverse transcriptase/maturase family protein [Azovibrio restrictus]